jgi:hypothetical protein
MRQQHLHHTLLTGSRNYSGRTGSGSAFLVNLMDFNP